MNFKSDDGREYEEVKGVSFMKEAEIDRSLDDVYTVIRPVKQEPKWEVVIKAPDLIDIYFYDKYPSPAQAQLIKESVEALLEYLSAPYDYENPAQHISAGREEIWHKARHSIMRENN